MATLREMLTKITFRTDRGALRTVNNQTDVTRRKLRAANFEARRLKRSFDRLALGMKALAAGVIGGAFAKYVIGDFAKATDEAAKFSKATGVSIETYQAFTHAAALSGASLGDLQKGLMQAGKRARDAAVGTKKTKDAFAELGVEVKDSRGNLKDQDQILMEAADRFRAMKDGSAKTALAMELFGRSGAKLIPMFNEGSAGIKKMMREAKKLGIVLTKDQAKIAEQYNDEMLRARSVLKGIRNQIAIKLLPAITRNIRAFQKWATTGDNLKRMLSRLALAAKIAAVAVGAIVTAKVLRAFTGLGGAIKGVIVWYQGLGKAALISYAKVFAIVAILALIVLAIQDFIVWVQGGDSVMGRMFGKPSAGVLKFVGFLKYLWGIVKQVWAVIVVGAKWVFKTLKKIWKILGPILLEVFKALWGVIKALWPVITALGRLFITVFRAVWPVLKMVLKFWWKIFSVILKITAKLLPPLARVLGWVLRKIVIPFFKALAWALGKVAIAVNWLVKVFRKVAAVVKKAWQKTIGWIIDKVMWLWKQLNKLFDAMDKLAQSDVGAMILTAAGGGARVAAARLKAARAKEMRKKEYARVQQQLRVGAVNVSIEGQTNMGSAEMQDAMAKGMAKALIDLTKKTFSNYQEQGA